MPNDAPLILLTRPERQSQEFREMLGLRTNVLISPILSIAPVEHQINIEAYSLLIFSSQNAVLSMRKDIKYNGLRAIAVGEKTAILARELGMQTETAGGTASELIKAVIRAEPKGKALFVRGRHTRGKISEQLNLAGIETDFVIVYDQISTPLNPEALALFRGSVPIVIPLFSPRSAELVSEQLKDNPGNAPIGLVAISANALEGWTGPDPDKVVVVDHPTGPEMAKEILALVDHWP